MSSKYDRWVIFGLYGLAGSFPDTISSPLFGDATITETTLANTITDERMRLAAEYMLGVRSWKESIDIRSVKHGEHLHQPLPNSFLAVRRKYIPGKSEAIDSAITRAREIAAALTIAKSHYSSNVSGFVDATSLHRGPIAGIIPITIMAEGTPPVFEESQQRVFTAPWLRDPDIIDASSLRASLNDDALLKTHDGRKWRISKKDAFASIMLNAKRSPAEQRIARAALHLYDAHHAPIPEQRLAQSVASLEMLFPGNTNFQLLERRILSLVPLDPKSQGQIAKIMQHRHEFVHDGQPIPSEVANLALGLSAMVMYIFAESCRKLGAIDMLLERLDLISSTTLNKSLSEQERREIVDRLKAPLGDAIERWTAIQRG